MTKQWKRVLYTKQDFSDNYADPKSFFDQLVIEYNSEQSTILSLILYATIVAQQFSVAAVFLTAYKLIIINDNILNQLTQLEVGILVLGFIIHYLLDDGNVFAINFFKNLGIFGMCLRIAAPVLQSLTSSFSEDTIHALAIAFTVIHLVSFDFPYVNGTATVFHGTLSLNAAMFTAIILASRINRLEVVILFLILAVILFSLFPVTSRLIRQKSITAYVTLFILIWILESIILYQLDLTLFAVYELALVMLVLVGPHWYLIMQRYKSAKRGPWGDV